MMTKATYSLIFALLLSYSLCGQKSHQQYMRPLTGINAQWHKIVLPNDVLTKLPHDLSSLRIMGITANGDTIFAPYLMQTAIEKSSDRALQFKLINQSENHGQYFFTFELDNDKVVNQINMEFAQKNYDWLAKVEGSQDMKEWYSLVDKYRILSIENEVTNYNFNKIVFPDAKYKFLRVAIKSTEKPHFLEAKLALHEFTAGQYQVYPHTLIKSKSLTKKSSICVLDLPNLLPLSKIKIAVKNKYDFYRPLNIEYLTDSFHTEKGWMYNYASLYNGTINSYEKAEYNFSTTFAQRIKITINNNDNAPLEIDSIKVLGPIHEIIARFDTAAKYYLTYTNASTTKPIYDISHFEKNIPESITTLSLGDEVLIKSTIEEKKPPFFQNKLWLWSLMFVIIAMLSWFSYKMIKTVK